MHKSPGKKLVVIGGSSVPMADNNKDFEKKSVDEHNL